MGWVSGIVVYFMTWWTVLFCILPLWVHPHAEQEHGTAGSAPENPHLGRKFVITTALSAVVWIGIYLLIESEIYQFSEMAEAMWQKHK